MKFAQLKIERAMRSVEISKHPSYMPYPHEHKETAGVNEVYVQLRPDLPQASRPGAVTLRNGNIYMISRNVPSKNVRPGMVLLLNLQRAAAMLADDTYEIATDEQIRVELERQSLYKKTIAEEDRRIRMNSSGVENNINVTSAPQAPINVQFVMPSGWKMVKEDEAAPQPAVAQAPVAPDQSTRRRGRPRATATTPSPHPSILTDEEFLPYNTPTETETPDFTSPYQR